MSPEWQDPKIRNYLPAIILFAITFTVFVMIKWPAVLGFHDYSLPDDVLQTFLPNNDKTTDEETEGESYLLNQLKQF